MAAAFLAEMRIHMAILDDVVAALAEADFKTATKNAHMHMTQGHRRWARPVATPIGSKSRNSETCPADR